MIAEQSITIKTDPYLAGQTIYRFNVPDQIKSVIGAVTRIKGLAVLHDGLLSKFESQTLMSAANLLGLTLRLVDTKDMVKFEDLAATSLLRAANGGFYFEMDNIDIDFQRCELYVQDTTGLTAGEIFCLEVIYTVTPS